LHGARDSTGILSVARRQFGVNEYSEAQRSDQACVTGWWSTMDRAAGWRRRPALFFPADLRRLLNRVGQVARRPMRGETRLAHDNVTGSLQCSINRSAVICAMISSAPCSQR